MNALFLHILNIELVESCWTNNSGEQILYLGTAQVNESQLPVHSPAKKSSC